MWSPTGNKVLVDFLTDSEKANRVELVVIRYYDKQPYTGKVVACGPEVKELKPDDFIIYGRYSFEVVKLDDKPYHILRESDVLAKVQSEAILSR